MVILAIADRPPSEPISILVEKYSIELICTLGDLDYFDIQELALINHIPKIGVYGNHCSGQYFEELGILNMHLNTFEFKGLVFGGFEGSLKYKESTYAKMYTQEEAHQLLENFPKVDVLLTHSPPFGINDEPNSTVHAGFKALRDYIEKQQPKYLLHGHTYPKEEDLVKKHQNTNIIYVFGDKIITL